MAAKFQTSIRLDSITERLSQPLKHSLQGSPLLSGAQNLRELQEQDGRGRLRLRWPPASDRASAAGGLSDLRLPKEL
jgi:hypothetical protein